MGKGKGMLVRRSGKGKGYGKGKGMLVRGSVKGEGDVSEEKRGWDGEDE